MAFFFKIRWKISSMLIIFYALFVCTLNMCAYSKESGTKDFDKSLTNIKSDSVDTGQAVNKSLAEVLLKAEIYTDNVSKKNAGIYDAFSKKTISDDERYLGVLKDLERTTTQGKILVSKVFSFYDYLNEKVNNMPTTDPEKIKLLVRIDELKSAAENFGILVNKPEDGVHKNSCQVLDVNDRLQVVMLTAGYLDGVRSGYEWTIREADNVKVKVIVVRAYLSAAIVLDDKIDRISPGMRAYLSPAEKKKTNN